MTLSPDFTRLSVGGRRASDDSDWMKKIYPDKQSWWIDPSGKVIDVGHDHEKYLVENPEIFGKNGDIREALRLNWVRIAYWNGRYIVHGFRISNAQLAVAQKLFSEVSRGDQVQIELGSKSGFLNKEAFLHADSHTDLIKALNRNPAGMLGSGASKRRFLGKQASLPKSRNFLMGVPLEEMPWALRQAFDITGLSPKKDKLSANQVASAFQASEQVLQEKLARSSTELIQDLNSFVQYGPLAPV